MTRDSKLSYIKHHYPALYDDLCRRVPKLVKSPDTATVQEIRIYNERLNRTARKKHYYFGIKDCLF